MPKLTQKACKALLRLCRCLVGKKGVYGKIGKGNKFTWNLRINEIASVGNYNYFGPGCLINNVMIGNYCSFAPNAIIGPGEHSIDYITTSQMISGPAFGSSLEKDRTRIGSDVWVGSNAVILQGVNVGTGAVIGAGAIVVKDIPPYAIAVGVPARVLRYRFDEETIRQIDNSKWYELDKKDAIAKTADLFIKVTTGRSEAAVHESRLNSKHA